MHNIRQWAKREANTTMNGRQFLTAASVVDTASLSPST